MSRIYRLLPLAVAALAFAVLMPASAPSARAAETSLPGIDVSHWQGDINWTQVRADGIRFAFIKATEDTWFVDNRYAANKAAAEAAGVVVGAYHFAQPSGGIADAVAEADHFIDNARLAGRNLLPVLDLEAHNGLSPRALRRWAKAWLARVEDRLGVKAIIYTGFYFWRDEVGNPTSFAQAGHRLWIARYGASEPKVPADNWAGRGWTIWQHSQTGSVQGIDGDVDLDRYAGTGLASIKIKNNR